MMGALMSACSLINAGAGTEEVSQQLKILENKFLAITKFQTIASALDFVSPLLCSDRRGGKN